jgi:hypothetical protein
MSSLPEAKALPDPPTDGISALRFLPSGTPDDTTTTTTVQDCSSLLASTSWDGCVRLHDTDPEKWCLQLSHAMESGPLLSLTTTRMSSATHADLITGGLDGSSK